MYVEIIIASSMKDIVIFEVERSQYSSNISTQQTGFEHPNIVEITIHNRPVHEAWSCILKRWQNVDIDTSWIFCGWPSFRFFVKDSANQSDLKISIFGSLSSVELSSVWFCRMTFFCFSYQYQIHISQQSHFSGLTLLWKHPAFFLCNKILLMTHGHIFHEFQHRQPYLSG